LKGFHQHKQEINVIQFVYVALLFK